ncbi:MAG: glycosyltransferase [Nostocales cyanobacterium 94392]|nr:glycosyltransferase [Nostocales cyanobacterium 94392]
MISLSKKRRFNQLILLSIWILVGSVLRFTNLTSKPVWIDEFATIVFSLGNSFKTVPLNQIISIDVLLQPLQINENFVFKEVLQKILTEDIHPPIYFILSHWWISLWSEQDLIFKARSISAIFGIASIGAIYGLARLSFRSVLIAQLAAAFIAVSPYGIFLAQEARHYTLGILWVIASLSCLVVAVRRIQQQQPLPITIALTWLVINAMGISTHYFFSFILFGQAIVLMKYWLNPQSKITNFKLWWTIYAAVIGTIATGLFWLNLFIYNRYTAELTQWIKNSDKQSLMPLAYRNFLDLLNPIFQSLAGWITMISLLPVESPQLAIVIASGLVMIIFFVWAIPILFRNFKAQYSSSENHLITQTFTGILLSVIALFFIITYFFGIDITRGARYNFVYFPVVMLLLGTILAACWHQNTFTSPAFPQFQVNGKSAVTIMWFMGLLSGITVVSNLGYQKYYRPDLLLPIIENISETKPVLIANTHRSLAETGEIMGIAKQIQKSNSPLNAKFLIIPENQKSNTATTTLIEQIQTLPRPFDLWLTNFRTIQKTPLTLPSCTADTQALPGINGYEYKIYHCHRLEVRG